MLLLYREAFIPSSLRRHVMDTTILAVELGKRREPPDQDFIF
jgi:hypothetical protein